MPLSRRLMRPTPRYLASNRHRRPSSTLDLTDRCSSRRFGSTSLAHWPPWIWGTRDQVVSVNERWRTDVPLLARTVHRGRWARRCSGTLERVGTATRSTIGRARGADDGCDPLERRHGLSEHRRSSDGCPVGGFPEPSRVPYTICCNIEYRLRWPNPRSNGGPEPVPSVVAASKSANPAAEARV